MKILVINCGSSSIKYKLYDFPAAVCAAKGLIDRIGEPGCVIPDHDKGIAEIFERLLRDKVITTLCQISVIGHRVVHGGETFRVPCVVDEKVLNKIRECSELAPLHNPANLCGIVACQKVMPGVTQVAVFDTAFHQTIPDYAYMYPIPRKYYDDLGVRKYGFHGTSHAFVSEQAARLLKKPLNRLKLITCHLGNGCSITAVKHGKSVDTSMGFTPLEGLMMGTRCGDIDVAAVFYLMEKEGLSLGEMDRILNRQSGILGIFGKSNDFRVLAQSAASGDKNARLALEMFTYRIKKYIGAYLMVLGGADAVCFTAGIGENNRALVKKMADAVLALVGKRTKVMVVPTDEELMIGSLAHSLVRGR